MTYHHDTSPPNHLGGYQLIINTLLRYDDLLVGDEGDGKKIFWADGFAGSTSDANGEVGYSGMSAYPYRVYRRMPCPHQGGQENVAFDRAESEAKPFAERTWEESGHFKWDNIKDNPVKAETYDDGKPPLANLPWEGIKAVSRVQAYGHKKYKDYNNFRKGMEVSRNLSCAIRHIAAYMEGETLDKESNESHLAHAACRILFVLQNEHDGVAIDDRFKK